MVKERSLFQILLGLARICAEIAVPIVLAFLAPQWLAFAYWPLALCGEWIEFEIRRKVTFLDIWVLGGNIAATRMIVHLVPGKWPAFIAGAAVFVALLSLHNVWRAKLGIRKAARPVKSQGEGARPHRSAWGADAPVMPSGETLRVLGVSEIAMGGPVTCDYLFPDGSLLCGCGASAVFTPDGRYFIAPLPSRQQWGLLLFDTREHLLYRRGTDVFWEIDFVDNESITGRHSPLVHNGSTTMRIDELLSDSNMETMVDVVDLKIPQSQWELLEGNFAPFDLPAPPPYAPAVIAKPYLPPSLLALDDPYQTLFDSELQLIVDGESSDLLLSRRYPEFVWREDGLAFACRVKPMREGATRSYFVWQKGQGWSKVEDREPLSRAQPFVRRDGIVAMDAEALTEMCLLALPSLSDETHGRIDRFLYDAAYVVKEEHFKPATFHEKISLHGGSPSFECAPLVAGHRLVFHWLQNDEDLARTVCRCSLDGVMLEGMWLLDHRISPDNAQVALIAYNAGQGIPHRIAILDVETAFLRWAEGSFPDPWFTAFSTDELHFVYLLGRRTASDDRRSQERTMAAEQVDEVVPPVDRARSFLLYRNDSSLHYKRAHLVRTQSAWRIEAAV
ncbi:MAG: hypothetical protein PW792_09940 [Acidobacteriaceae bacterium]|nr:hypothetical protein [Acidobacteriaceae bacterium]